jgi:DNA mismatch repair ATPase MutS
LLRKLENSFPNATFKPVKRSLFDDTRGYRIYSERGNKNKGDLNPDNRVMKMLACSALAALLVVIESDLKLNVKYDALHIEWHYPSNVLIIDEQTVSDLELFVNS